MIRASLLPLFLVALAGCVPELVSDGLVVDGGWVAPDNSWPMGQPPADLEGEGFYDGEVVPDFLLVDQFGDEVSLWQFHGRPVVLDISTMWCGPCRALAEGAQATADAYEADGLVYLTVLPEDVEGAPPSIEDLNLWAGEYGLASPVIADPDENWSGPAVPQDQYPFVAVLDRGLHVAARPNPPTDENVRVAIDALLE